MRFAKLKTLPQAPVKHHHPALCQDRKTLPRAPAKYRRHAPRIVPRQKPCHEHLRSITATRFAKTNPLPQAAAKNHRHAQRVVPRQKPYRKHLRSITATRLANKKASPQAPAKHHRHAPRVVPRQKPHHKHLRSITTTRFARTLTLRKAPAKCHNHWFCQDTWEVSPPRILPRQHLPTSTCDIPPPRAMRCAKTQTLPQAPAKYHHHAFCQDKNLATSTCEE